MTPEDVERYTRTLEQARVAYDERRFAEARKAAREVLALATRIWTRSSPELIRALTWVALATSGDDHGRPKRAVVLVHERILRLSRAAWGDRDERTLSALERVALDRWGLGKRSASLRLYLRVLSVLEAQFDDDHYRMSMLPGTIGALLVEMSRPSEAIPFLRRAARIADRRSHALSRVIARRMLGRALLDAGQPRAATRALALAVRLGPSAGIHSPLAARLEAWLSEARASSAALRRTEARRARRARRGTNATAKRPR